MIKKERFKEIKKQVEESIDTLYDSAKQNQKNPNDYVLFLANAENVERYHEYGENPHILDYRIFKLQDSDRRKFLINYLNTKYQFQEDETSDDINSLTIELMIYTHIWESKPFLRHLSKLSDLALSIDYQWYKEIPDFGKHDFIRTLRDSLNQKGLQIGEVITCGFHTSLRNAFAHSQYYFDFFGYNKIHLTNYKEGEWELKEISYKEWTERFCHTFLLSHHFQNKFELEKETLIPNHDYEVKLKDRNGNDIDGYIKYDSQNNSFSGRIK